MRQLLVCLFCLLVGPAWAACEGSDLIAEMSAEDRAALMAQADADPYPEGLVWRAERGAERVHIVGTLHVGDPRHAATMARIKPLIDSATTVFLEIGEGDEARLNAHIADNPGLAFIVEGPTLIDLLPPEDWAELKGAMAERGVPGFMAAKMKPWMAMMTLGLSQCVVEAVQSGDRGLDHMVMEYAREIGNPARALEEFDTALRIFEVYSEDEMLSFLRLFLRMDQVDPDDQHATLVEAYFREEVRVIWHFGVQQSLGQDVGMTEADLRAEFARMEDALNGSRNRSWMPRILSAVTAGEVFVAAGALHLTGDQGLLRLLEREGFTLTRLSRTAAD